MLSVACSLYLPAAQLVQTVLAVPTEYLPAPQSKQSPTTVAPGVARYLPAPHAEHVSVAAAPMAGPWYPALHVHAVLADEPAADAAFVPQVLQSVKASTSVAAAGEDSTR